MSAPWNWTRDDRSTDFDALALDAEEEVEREVTDAEVLDYARRHGWEPVTKCSLCDRPLGESRMLQICEVCEATARAHARSEASRREWNRDVAADPELGRVAR
jgi:hypothetical protein